MEHHQENNHPTTGHCRKSRTAYGFLIIVCLHCMMMSLFSCQGAVEHLAEAIHDEDSIPFMRSRGINTLISDSGMMRYHMVAEEWDICNIEGESQTTWRFKKGLLMERFDKDFHIDLFVQADTAYLHKQTMWELRGRVVIRNVNGDIFKTEELFWDMEKHEMWSHKFMHIITPDRELQGTEFRSNEEMTKYSVANSAGAFPVSDTENSQGEPSDTIQSSNQDASSGTSPSDKKRFPPAPEKEKQPLKLRF